MTKISGRFVFAHETYLPIHIKNQATVETMNFTGWTCSKEIENCSICRFSDFRGVIHIYYIEHYRALQCYWIKNVAIEFTRIQKNNYQIGQWNYMSCTTFCISKFLCFKLEKAAHTADILLKSRKTCHYEGLLCITLEKFFVHFNEVGALLGEVYWTNKKLPWKRSSIFFQNYCLFIFKLKT